MALKRVIIAKKRGSGPVRVRLGDRRAWHTRHQSRIEQIETRVAVSNREATESKRKTPDQITDRIYDKSQPTPPRCRRSTFAPGSKTGYL